MVKENIYYYLVNCHILMQSNISSIKALKKMYNSKDNLKFKIYTIDRISENEYYYLARSIIKSPNCKFDFNYLN